MRATVVLLALALACSSANAFGVSQANKVHPLLEKIISANNEELVKFHMDKMELKPFVVDGLLYRLTVKGGEAGNLGTITLVGDDQVVEQTDGDDYSLYNYDIKIGLKELVVRLDYEYTFLRFFGGSGSVYISTDTDTVRAKGSVKYFNYGVCKAVLESTEVTELRNFNIQFVPDSIRKIFLKYATSFFFNYIVPFYKSTIDNYVADYVKNEVPKSRFEVAVCTPLHDLYN
uniref:Uncharacterized protein n=1 Tax=Riptortus pedestris TaxID=329032 RepID=R4WR11_RIPPE|nr:unknown secreted protein [Riptortus pedestris]